MKTKTRRVGAAAAAMTVLVGSSIAMVAGAPDAQAGVSVVCHYGVSNQPPVYVLERGGAEYAVYPGECTPGDVDILGVKPANGTSMFFTQSTTGERTFRKEGVAAVGTRIQWWSTLGNDIYVYKTRYGH